MSKFSSQLSYILLILVVVGAGVIAFSVYEFITAENRRNEIQDERDELQATFLEVQASGDSTTLVPLGIRTEALRQEDNDLISQQNSALRRGGVGLVLIALAWLSYDWRRAKQKKAATVS